MKKVIKIELEDGRLYRIDANTVADNRAMYFAEKSPEEYDRIYTEEYEYAMSDESELLDWLMNNMNWYQHEPVLVEKRLYSDLKDCKVEDYYIDEVWE